MYGDSARAWDESERAAIQSFNAVIEAQIASALAFRHHGRVVEQLQYALENRVTIERAIGMLMARHDLDAVAAFHLLRNDAPHQPPQGRTAWRARSWRARRREPWA